MLEPKIVNFPKKIIMGLQDKLVDFEVIPHIWQRFNTRRSEIPGAQESADLGIVLSTDGEEKIYLAGTEIMEFEKIPEGMTTLHVPPGKYAVFIHQGPSSALQETLKQIYESWVPQSQIKLRNAPQLEVYDLLLKEGDPGYQFEICVPVE